MLFGGMLQGLQEGQQYKMNQMKMQEEQLRLDTTRRQQAQEQAFTQSAAPIVQEESDFLGQLAGRADADTNAVRLQEMQTQLKSASQLEALAFQTGNLDKAEYYGKQKAEITEKMYASQKEQRLQDMENMKEVASITMPMFTMPWSLPDKQQYYAANRANIAAHLSPEQAKQLPATYDGKPQTDALLRGLATQSVSSYQQLEVQGKQADRKQKAEQFRITIKKDYDLANQRFAIEKANLARLEAKDEVHVSDERKAALRELIHRGEAAPTAQELKDTMTAIKEKHPQLSDSDVKAAAEQTLKKASSLARDNYTDLAKDEDAPLYSRGEQIDQALGWMDQNGAYMEDGGYVGGLFSSTTFTPPKMAAEPKTLKGSRTVEHTRTVRATTSSKGSATLQQARDAIAAGAPRDAVIARLKKMGIDPTGL